MISKIWYLKNARLFSRLDQTEIEDPARTTEMVACR